VRSLVPAPWFAGVDGCKGGWFVLLLRYAGDRVETMQHRLCRDFEAVIALREEPVRVAVDIPIGLLDHARPGGRACDQEARRLLGNRRSSVFTPPVRAVLAASDYQEALSLSHASSDINLGLSRQAWNIADKIREVDERMTPAQQTRIVESHPELAFLTLADKPMRHNKKHAEGRSERLRLLKRHLGRFLPDPDALRTYYGAKNLAADDIVDACVLALVARRIHLGQGQRVPGDPPIDARGLRMEIWY
jgi:predicted RNase H-like nuclease